MKFNVKKILIVLMLGTSFNIALGISKPKQPQFKPTEVEFRLAPGEDKYVLLSIYYKNGKSDRAMDVFPSRPLTITIPAPIEEIQIGAEPIDPLILAMINDRIAHPITKSVEEEGWVDIQIEKPIFEIKKLAKDKYTIAIKAR